MTENEQIEEMEDLLIEFDEMGFQPTTTVPDPEEFAVRWKNRLINALKDYRKVERGEWVSVGYGGLKCSVCETEQENEIYRHKYCPECGADMRGEGK